MDDEKRNVPAYQPLLVLLAACALGIVVDDWLGPPPAVWLIGGSVLLLVWSSSWLRGPNPASSIALLLSAACFCAVWHHLYWNCYPADELSRFVRSPATSVRVEATALTGSRVITSRTLSGERRRDEPFSRFLCRIHRVKDAGRWRPASGEAQVVVSGRLDDVRAGDRLRIHGIATRPSPSKNPGGFDAAAHQRGQRRLTALRCAYPECVESIRAAPFWNPRGIVEAVRLRGESLLIRYVGPSRGDLAAALLLGTRDRLDRDVKQRFFVSGVIHLLAISGLHVGILASGFWLLRRLGILSRRATLMSTAGFVCAYALVTDGRPPVVRAAVLLVAFCLGQYLGRPVRSVNCLAAAGLLLIAHCARCIFQPGLQLSFLAVATLIFLADWTRRPRPVDPLTRLVRRTRPWPFRAGRMTVGIVWAGIRATAFVWLVTTPLVLYHFHLVSPAALALNPLLSLPITVALFSGMGVLVFGGWLPPVAWTCGRVCDASLAAVQWVIDFALRFTSGVWFPAPDWWWLIGFYGLLAAGWSCRSWWVGLRHRHLVFATILIIWCVVGLTAGGVPWAGIRSAESERLACTFLSVGHGTCVVLEMPGGEILVYDAGSLGNSTPNDQRITGFLWHRGVRRIDTMLLSHADVDHFGAAPGLLQRFRVSRVLVSAMMFQGDSPALRELKEAIDRSAVPVRVVRAGDLLTTRAPDVRLEVLHPTDQGVPGGDNANSVVLSVRYRGYEILLPGDLEEEGLERVLRSPPREVDVLMAPHHGSARSAPERFAAWASADWVVVSSGSGDRSLKAEAIYRRHGSRVLHTHREGAVRITVDRQGLFVHHWHVDRWRSIDREGALP